MYSTSINAQIKATERLILNRQRMIDRRTTTLTRNLYQQMTAPATLWLAGGIGFIVGELSKCRRSTSDKPHTTSLRTLLKLITSARTLYAALPIAWLMKSRYQMDTSVQTPEQRLHSVSAGNRRRARRD